MSYECSFEGAFRSGGLLEQKEDRSKRRSAQNGPSCLFSCSAVETSTSSEVGLQKQNHNGRKYYSLFVYFFSKIGRHPIFI